MSLEDAAVPGLVTCRLVFGSVIGVLRKAQGVKQKLLGCGWPIQGSGTLDCQLNHCPLHVGVDESLTSKQFGLLGMILDRMLGFHRILP